MTNPKHAKTFALTLASSFALQLALSFMVCGPEPAMAVGPIAPPPPPVRTRVLTTTRKAIPVTRGSSKSSKIKRYAGGVAVKSRSARKKKAQKRVPAKPPRPPQELVNSMSVHTIAPGVVHKVHRAAMYINLLDIDLTSTAVHVKPVLAGTSFNRLDEVKDQASRVRAIAAVNGNYFKRDGTPLGTLIIDGEWIAGPLYDRTCLGITNDGKILVDRVNLHGSLESSNPEIGSIWINNINQPRRTGSKLVAYTRRWGDLVRMSYAGTLVAIDASGRVIDKTTTVLGIPYGGVVLSDSKDSPIGRLAVGDRVRIKWETRPNGWDNVVHAISGGPVLIRDGNLYVGLKDENFRKTWTSNKIHARTAVGVTANRHLLLATIEGPHTLWDVAKFLKRLGAVDAINLDGGGSTTMVVQDTTVTRNKSTFQRRVASSLVVLPGESNASFYKGLAANYNPTGEYTDITPTPSPDPAPVVSTEASQDAAAEAATQAEATLPESGLPPDSLTVEEPKKNKKKSYFGWMKHLVP